MLCEFDWSAVLTTEQTGTPPGLSQSECPVQQVPRRPSLGSTTSTLRGGTIFADSVDFHEPGAFSDSEELSEKEKKRETTKERQDKDVTRTEEDPVKELLPSLETLPAEGRKKKARKRENMCEDTQEWDLETGATSQYFSLLHF